MCGTYSHNLFMLGKRTKAQLGRKNRILFIKHTHTQTMYVHTIYRCVNYIIRFCCVELFAKMGNYVLFIIMCGVPIQQPYFLNTNHLSFLLLIYHIRRIPMQQLISMFISFCSLSFSAVMNQLCTIRYLCFL